MTKLQPRSGAEVTSAANDNELGESEARALFSRIPGRKIGDIHIVAMQLGLLVSSGLLTLKRAQHLLTQQMELRQFPKAESPDVLETFDWSATLATNVDDLTLCGTPQTGDPLPIIDPRAWDGQVVPEREWFVTGLIPHRTVTNLSGAGGSGKTELMLQLMASSSFGTHWFGKEVASGPCLYYGAEDEADELHRRLAKIVERAGRTFSELEGIRLIPMAGLDAVLAEPNKAGQILETVMFPKLKAEAARLEPRLIVIDPSADVFGGDEINRAQVRKFVSMLRGLAMDHDCAVLLLSHPSLTGLNTGTGTSGSTAWSNSVRSRLYLEVPKLNDGPDPEARILKVVKANYGRIGEEIRVRWDDGIYVLDKGVDAATELVINARVDQLFLELLLLFTEQQQNLCATPGTSYAPAKMAKHPKAKGFSKEQLAGSMQRLLDKKVIKILTEGTKARSRSRLVLVEAA